jgi:hypothetical protein
MNSSPKSVLRLALTFAVAAAPSIILAQPKPGSWERHAFSLPESIWSVEALDANGDGKQDLVAMGVTKVFALLSPDWRRQILFDSQEGKMLYCVTLDVDHDGDLDLVVGRYQVPWIEFRQARAAGKSVPGPKGPDFSVGWIENVGKIDAPWPLHVIDHELNGIHGLGVGDVDGDGYRDVIADSISGPHFPNSVVWFRAPARGERVFSRQVVTRDGADGRPHYLDFGDVDRDGRPDILLGDSGGGTFTWWQRGTNKDEPWTKHLIAREKGGTNIKLADLDGDQKPDVVATCGHGKGVFWFQGPAWQKHEIDAALATPHALATADFDGDGDLDVAVASYTAFVVRWYVNDGRGRFVPHDIETENRQQAYDLKSMDLDGDGVPDLILAGRETRNAVWYRFRR